MLKTVLSFPEEGIVPESTAVKLRLIGLYCSTTVCDSVQSFLRFLDSSGLLWRISQKQ